MSPDAPSHRGPLRRALDRLYDVTGALAAAAMVLLLVAVLLSVLSRQLHFNIAGIDAYAGYLMAATGFLALAHTLKRGEHIRVTLLLGALRGRALRAMSLWALAASTVLSALFAFYAVRLAWQSHTMHDISTGNDATPLWIPQVPMAVGALVLLIAFVDELVLEWRGRRAPAAPGELARTE